MIKQKKFSFSQKIQIKKGLFGLLCKKRKNKYIRKYSNFMIKNLLRINIEIIFIF